MKGENNLIAPCENNEYNVKQLLVEEFNQKKSKALFYDTR